VLGLGRGRIAQCDSPHSLCNVSRSHATVSTLGQQNQHPPDERETDDLLVLASFPDPSEKREMLPGKWWQGKCARNTPAGQETRVNTTQPSKGHSPQTRLSILRRSTQVFLVPPQERAVRRGGSSTTSGPLSVSGLSLHSLGLSNSRQSLLHPMYRPGRATGPCSRRLASSGTHPGTHSLAHPVRLFQRVKPRSGGARAAGRLWRAHFHIWQLAGKQICLQRSVVGSAATHAQAPTPGTM
jgi:hypothetical protein